MSEPVLAYLFCSCGATEADIKSLPGALLNDKLIYISISIHLTSSSRIAMAFTCQEACNRSRVGRAYLFRSCPAMTADIEIVSRRILNIILTRITTHAPDLLVMDRSQSGHRPRPHILAYIGWHWRFAVTPVHAHESHSVTGGTPHQEYTPRLICDPEL